MPVCYENRHGMLCAYDTQTKKFVNPRGEDVGFLWFDPILHEWTPEEVRAALDTRGVKSVLVYTGKREGSDPSWVDGQIVNRKSRHEKFAHLAAQSGRCENVWTEVPVERIADGSDWSDIYRHPPTFVDGTADHAGRTTLRWGDCP